MASRSRRVHPRLLAILLILVAPAAVLADGDGTEPSQPPPAAETAPDLTYALGGVTISWDLGNKRFQAPTAEQAARIAAAFAAPAAEEKIEVEKLPDGTEKARIPAHLLSASIVRVVPDGELVGFCAEPGVEIPVFSAEETEEER